MGMFENPVPFRDHFQEGQTFNLTDAKPGPTMQTDYGEGRPVLLKIGNQWYSIFGAGLLTQVERMAPGDLPARVSIERVPTRSGRQVKMLVPDGVDPADFGAKAAPDTAADDIPF